MKKLVAALLCMAILSTTVFGISYYDEGTVNKSVSVLSRLSVLLGDTDGDFRVDDTLSRAEMAMIIARVGVYELGRTDVPFSDLEGSFAKDAVAVLYERGIINGYEDGTFRPNESLTYGEYLTVLVRFFLNTSSVEQENLDFPDGYADKARELGIITDEAFDLSAPITRGDAAVLTYNILDIPFLSSPEPSSEPAATFDPEGTNAFAYSVNSEMDKESNYMLSPLSIKTALAMAANGADGNTKSEILDVLGISDLTKFNREISELIERYKGDFDWERYNELDSIVKANDPDEEEYIRYFELDNKAVDEILTIDEMNEYNSLKKSIMFNGLTEDEYNEYVDLQLQIIGGKDIQLNIANSIWLNEDYYTGADVRFNTVFENTIKEYYDGESAVVNSSNAVDSINSWTFDKTNGKIPTVINDSDFLAALINAVYFKASWQNEFSKSMTDKGEFNNFDGTVSETDFMHRTGYYNIYSDSNVQMIALPYAGGATMYISVDNGGNIDYNSYFDKLKATYVNLTMPKFKIEYSSEMNDILKDLGVNTAFDRYLAGFDGMLDNIPNGENVYIDSVIHKTYINVDEEGTEAAAVTAVINKGTTAAISPEPIEFTINKPFTFMIIDDQSGEILFMGRYAAAE